MEIIAPGGTWVHGFDFGDLSAAGSNQNFAGYVFRNGEPASAALDHDPVVGQRPGLYVATLYVPADWSPGDILQVLMTSVWENQPHADVWLPPFTLLGPIAAAALKQ